MRIFLLSVRVNLRLLRLFPINHATPVYTVEEILQGNTEELRTLQRFISKHNGEDKRQLKADSDSVNTVLESVLIENSFYFTKVWVRVS